MYKYKLNSIRVNYSKKYVALVYIMVLFACFAIAFLIRYLPLFIFSISALFLILATQFKIFRSVGIICFSFSIAIGIVEIALTVRDMVATVSIKKYGANLTEDLGPATHDPNSDYPKRYFSKNRNGTAITGTHTARLLDSKGGVIYDVQYSIGADGFRITPSIDENSKIIVNFYGCSFMFGEGLNDWETIPFFVSRQLNSVRVNNYGFHGFGANNALDIMESTRDLIVGQLNFFLTAPWHAPRGSCKPSWVTGFPRYIMKDDSVLKSGNCRSGVLSKVAYYSKLYSLIEKAFNYESVTDDDFALPSSTPKRIFYSFALFEVNKIKHLA